MPGPSPLPAKILKLHGNPGGRPIKKDQPDPPVKVPRPPIKLGKIARKQWKYIVPKLKELGVIAEIDGAALAAYCQTFAQWVELEDVMDRDSQLDPDDDNKLSLGERLSVGRALMQVRKQIRMMLGEFGMTPASRGKVSVKDYRKPLDEYEVWEKGTE